MEKQSSLGSLNIHYVNEVIISEVMTHYENKWVDVYVNGRRTIVLVIEGTPTIRHAENYLVSFKIDNYKFSSMVTSNDHTWNNLEINNDKTAVHFHTNGEDLTDEMDSNTLSADFRNTPQTIK